MKKKVIKTAPIAIFIIIAILISASSSVKHTNLNTEQGDSVKVSYMAATTTNDTLQIDVNYDSYGKSFEVAKNITVYTDPELTEELELINAVPFDDHYTYTFSLDEPIDNVYISPPTLYMPTEIDETSINLSPSMRSSVAKLNNEDWFSISSIDVNEVEPFTGIVSDPKLTEIKISIESYNETLPRYPTLAIGGQEFGGISVLYFDENGIFETGNFTFYIPEETIQTNASSLLMNHVSLIVKDALTKTSADEAIFSSNVKSLNINVQ